MLLAIETATPEVSVALLANGKVIGERVGVELQRHTELLVPLLDVLLADCGVSPTMVTTVAVDKGPGLFTGLRVGIATAQAIAFASGAQLVGVESLRAMLRRFPEATYAVLDAKRGEVAVQRRDSDMYPRLCDPQDLAAELSSKATETLVGSGAIAYAEYFAAHQVLPGTPRAREIAILAYEDLCAGITTDSEPLYLRASDAEVRSKTS